MSKDIVMVQTLKTTGLHHRSTKSVSLASLKKVLRQKVDSLKNIIFVST